MKRGDRVQIDNEDDENYPLIGTIEAFGTFGVQIKLDTPKQFTQHVADTAPCGCRHYCGKSTPVQGQTDYIWTNAGSLRNI